MRPWPRAHWPLKSEARIIIVEDPLVPTLIGHLIPNVAKWIEESNSGEVEWMQKLAERATERLRSAELTVSSAVLNGDPKRVLIEEAEKWGADSIFVGSTGFSNRFERFMLGSVSAAVAARAHCSVEVVRAARKRKAKFGEESAVGFRGRREVEMEKMKANVFRGKNDIRVEEVERPRAGVGEAVIRVTLTTICGTDLHIVRGEYPVKPGLVIGHEPVGVDRRTRAGRDRLRDRRPRARRRHHALRPVPRLPVGALSRSAATAKATRRSAAGASATRSTARRPNTCSVPHAQANLAKIPDELTDEQVVLLADIASTGFSGAESGDVRIGDAVVVFAQGPIGLCATAGAKLMGAALVIGVDGDENRLAMAKRMGADVVLDYREVDVVVGSEAADGRRARTSRSKRSARSRRSRARSAALRPGGTLSSLGVYSGKLQIPYDAFAAGLGDHRDRDDALPRRQGADAPADGSGQGAAAST